MRLLPGLGCVLLLSTTVAAAAPQPVIVFLERNGHLIGDDTSGIEIPRFGGGDRTWKQIVSCVANQFSPFQVTVVDRRPAAGAFITAVIGGRASQFGLDDRTTNGLGSYAEGRLIPDAVVHVFSRVGTGERDAPNLCAVTVHEVGHALGLDHSTKCGDVMSYHLDRCGPRRILDAEAPCGEADSRTCGDGRDAQNSFRKLAATVGLRDGAEPNAEPELGQSPGLDLDVSDDLVPEVPLHDPEADPGLDVTDPEAELDDVRDADPAPEQGPTHGPPTAAPQAPERESGPAYDPETTEPDPAVADEPAWRHPGAQRVGRPPGCARNWSLGDGRRGYPHGYRDRAPRDRRSRAWSWQPARR